jgi:hypothetical protein
MANFAAPGEKTVLAVKSIEKGMRLGYNEKASDL